MLTSIPFAVSGIDRADARRRDLAGLDAAARDPASRHLLLWRGKPLCAGEALAWLAPADLVGLDLDPALPRIFLGLADGRPCFAVALAPGDPPPGLAAGGRAFVDARMAAATLPLPESGALAQARSLLEWHRAHPFCARCGAASGASAGGYKRVCATCRAEHFPRTDPVVIMLVHRGDRCLLGRQPQFPPGLLTCLAGFVEPGETIEAAVAREVAEEAGVLVSDVRYVASQPWPFPSQLMIGCEAVAESEAITVDTNELAEARWVERAQVRRVLAGGGDGSLWFPPPVAIAHHLLAAWARR